MTRRQRGSQADRCRVRHWSCARSRCSLRRRRARRPRRRGSRCSPTEPTSSRAATRSCGSSCRAERSARELRLTAGHRKVTGALERTGQAQARGTGEAAAQRGGTPLAARIRHGGAARLEVTNHPIGGPVFAGPQIQPWTCQATARDAQCDRRRSSSTSTCPRALRPRGRAARAPPATEPAAARSSRTTRRTRRRRTTIADDDDHRGRDRPVHRPARDRLHRPRPVRDRGPLRPGQAVDGDGAPAPVQPPAGDHARLLLRHRVQDRRRAERARAEGPGRRASS